LEVDERTKMLEGSKKVENSEIKWENKGNGKEIREIC
jgi:hypothetical protein